MRVNPSAMEDMEMGQIGSDGGDGRERSDSYKAATQNPASVPPRGDVSSFQSNEEKLKKGKGVGPLLTRNQSSLNREAYVELTFKDISFTPKVMEGTIPRRKAVEKEILKGVSGAVSPGEILAVVGPSSAGKTVLLDILAGRVVNNVGGRISVNGYDRPHGWGMGTAYVQQEEYLTPVLTVTETLRFAASFKLPSSMPADKRELIVEELIDELGLRIAAHTKVGNAFIRGCSGGQKKRVSIGVELVRRTGMVFLDAPTGGLDSTAALALVKQLSVLTSQGRSVIMVVDQPSVKMLDIFDKTLILSEGRMVFCGPTLDAVPFFAQHGLDPGHRNPMDYFVSKVNRDFPDSVDPQAMADAFAQSDMYRKVVAEIDETDQDRGASPVQFKRQISFLKEVSLLSHLHLLDSIRNPMLYWLRLGLFVVLMLMVGALYFDIGTNSIDNRLAVIFFTLSFAPFMSIAAVPAFIENRLVFTRERASGMYRPLAYVIANTFGSLPWIILIGLISGYIVYYMVGLNDSGSRPHWFILLYILALYCSESLMVCVSAIAPMALIGMAAGCMVFGIFMLTSGFFISRSNAQPYWIYWYYVSFHRYAFEAAAYNDMQGVNFTYPLSQTGTIEGATYLKDFFDISGDPRTEWCVVLGCMCIVFRIIFALLIQFFVTGKKG